MPTKTELNFSAASHAITCCPHCKSSVMGRNSAVSPTTHIGWLVLMLPFVFKFFQIHPFFDNILLVFNSEKNVVFKTVLNDFSVFINVYINCFQLKKKKKLSTDFSFDLSNNSTVHMSLIANVLICLPSSLDSF